MAKKSKTGSYKGPKRTYIVHHKHGIIPIEEYGDLIKGKPKLAKKGWR